MKNNIKYIKRIGIFVLALVMTAACVKWEQETSPTLESASTVTLAVLSSGDSSVVVSYSSSANGYVALNLFEGTGNEVPAEEADREAFLTGNVTSMEYIRSETEAGTVYQYTFEGLIQNTSYEVMGVANNSDGVVSQAELLPIATADNYNPVLTGTDPEVTYDPILPIDGSVTLIFDEPILYDDTKDLTFSEFYDGEDVVAGSVTVSGNTATVALGADLTNRDYVLLSYPEGAFTDLAGNPADSVASYLDGSSFVGLYWRAEAKDFEAVSVTPTDTYQDPGFDIVVTFAEGVSVSGVEDGDITLTYDDGLDVLTKAVLASELSAAGNELTITQSYMAPQGVEVMLSIPEDVLSIGIGNPNAEVAASWIIAHPTMQSLVGDYDIDAASYNVPGDYDEAWVASIAANPFDLNTLLVTVNGGNTFAAAFDIGAGTVAIPAGTNAGDFYGYGPTVFYLGDYSYIDPTTDITGTLEADGSILIDELAVYLPNYSYYWDAFNTTWTPVAKKAAPSYGNIATKAAGIK